MKKLVAVFAFISVLFSANAHEYYFAFAEVEYNQSDKKLEITLEISAHDLEAEMKKSGIRFEKHIEDQTKNADFKKQLESHITKGFSISANNSPIPLKLIGFDVLPTGLLYAYFESSPLELNQALSFKFDLLMESFPDQQNKITFIRNNNKQTASNKQQKPTNKQKH